MPYSIDLELSSSQYASISDASQTGLDINSDITFQWWIKMEQLPSTAGSSFWVMTKWLDSGGGQRQYRFGINISNLLIVIFTDGSGNTTEIRSTTALDSGDVGVWKYCSINVDISVPTASMYIGDSNTAPSDAGTNVVASLATSIRTDGGAAFAIGAQNIGGTVGGYVDGKIYNARLWSDLRTSGETAADYKQIKTNTGSDNLVDVWYFRNNDHGSASGDNDLLASGSPAFDTDVAFVSNTGVLLGLI